MDSNRHVIGCHYPIFAPNRMGIPNLSVYGHFKAYSVPTYSRNKGSNAFDDVASTIHQSLQPGEPLEGHPRCQGREVLENKHSTDVESNQRTESVRASV